MLGKRGSSSPEIFGARDALTRFTEWRQRLEHLEVDGSGVQLNGQNVYAPGAPGGAIVTALAGSSAPVSFRADNRTMWDYETGIGARHCLAHRPYAAVIWSHGWADTFPALTGLMSAVNYCRRSSVTISSWMRKKAAGEATHSRRTFGFASNVALSPSAANARCGLVGDGALGFRFGSVNCPDGAAAGENGPADIDANFIQPDELVNPGVAWFHVAVKMLPPAPTQPGKWLAFLNGRLIKTFDLLANLPRGGGALSGTRAFSSVEPTITAFGDAAAIIPSGFMTWDLRVRVADEWFDSVA